MRFDGRKGYWLAEDGKKAQPAPKSKYKSSPARRSERIAEQEDEAPDEKYLGPFVESCVGDAGRLGMVFNPGAFSAPAFTAYMADLCML